MGLPLPVAPFVEVLETVTSTLAVFDWGQYLDDVLGLDGEGNQIVLTVRDERGVAASDEERPALLVRITSDEPEESDVGVGFGVYGELRMLLGIELVFDADLPTALSEADVTGLSFLASLAVIAVKVLKDAVGPDDLDSPLGDISAAVIERGRAPGENNTSDEGRLVQSLDVLYRVRDDDPTVLLRKGVNA